MARKLKVLLNIGLEDQAKYAIPDGPGTDEPPHEGDVISLDDELAAVLVKVGLVEDYDAKKEEALAKKTREFDERNIAQHQAGITAAEPRAAKTSAQFNEPTKAAKEK